MRRKRKSKPLIVLIINRTEIGREALNAEWCAPDRGTERELKKSRNTLGVPQFKRLSTKAPAACRKVLQAEDCLKCPAPDCIIGTDEKIEKHLLREWRKDV